MRYKPTAFHAAHLVEHLRQRGCKGCHGQEHVASAPATVYHLDMWRVEAGLQSADHRHKLGINAKRLLYVRHQCEFLPYQ